MLTMEIVGDSVLDIKIQELRMRLYFINKRKIKNLRKSFNISTISLLFLIKILLMLRRSLTLIVAIRLF